MDDNERHIIDGYVAVTEVHAHMSALTGVLRDMVDKADIAAATSIHLTEGQISTDEIRQLFGWSMCNKAQNAINKREGRDA